MSEDTVKVPGALIKGGDGTVYFVPQPVLDKHKVGGPGADAAGELFDDDEVSGFSFGHTIDASVGQQLTVMQAFEGPFGIAAKSLGVGEEPTDVDSNSVRFFRR